MPLWDHKHPGILIDDGDIDLFVKASRDLNKLRSKPIGYDLITLLTKRLEGIGCQIPVNRLVVIERAPGTLNSAVQNTKASADTYRKQWVNAMRDSPKIPGSVVRIPGKGSGSIVQYNPDAEAEYTKSLGILTPAFIALGHELIHSLHHLSGAMRVADGPDMLQARFAKMLLYEEANTVGLGPYVKTRISENALRKEWGLLPLRTYYDKPGDCDNLVSLVGT